MADLETGSWPCWSPCVDGGVSQAGDEAGVPEIGVAHACGVGDKSVVATCIVEVGAAAWMTMT
jgi:hypothetical protein